METDDGRLALTQGGGALALNGEPRRLETLGEYPDLYRRFGELIAAGASDVDLSPLILVADAFLLGRRLPAAPFHE